MMGKAKISIVGAGQMGTQIGKAACKDNDVIFYDIDHDKSRSAAKLYNAGYSNTLQEIDTPDIIFLCVPKNAVMELIHNDYVKGSTETLWVNICTFITRKEIINTTGSFERISPTNKGVFIIHSEHPENERMAVVEDILQNVGAVIYDDENKYLEVNYIAASEAMKGVLHTANLLREKGIGEKVINAAIRQIFIGSALQFPYAEPDYFHELVYQRNPGLKELNEGILKMFKNSATKTR
jgi:pyrroline-5-carboxylate reductase